MSIDIDLIREENGSAVSLLCSAGVYRLFTARTEDGELFNLRLSPPITPESLQEVRKLLDSFDVDEYREIYNKAVSRSFEKTFNL